MAISRPTGGISDTARRQLLPDEKSERRLLSRAELASCLGVTPTAIDGYVRRGCPVTEQSRGKGRGRGAKFFLPDVVDWRRDRRTSSQPDRPGTDDAELSRRLLQANTESAELDMARKSGELMTVDEFSAVIRSAFANLGAALRSSAPKHAVVSMSGNSPTDHASIVEQLLRHLESQEPIPMIEQEIEDDLTSVSTGE